MRKLTASIAILLSFIAITGVASIITDKTQIKVSYYDLEPEAKRQVDCLADNIYFEARTEPRDGQKAVALVTMNRVQSGNFPKTVCGVVKQQVQSTCQFSWWCDSRLRSKALSRRFDQDTYEKIQLVALEVYLNHNRIRDITKGALYYHADYVPKQALGMNNLQKTVKIGQHIFYRTPL